MKSNSFTPFKFKRVILLVTQMSTKQFSRMWRVSNETMDFYGQNAVKEKKKCFIDVFYTWICQLRLNAAHNGLQ